MATVSLDTLRQLMQHMEWADASVWRALLAHPAAFQDTRLRDLLLHLHGVQRGFLAVWTARPLEPRLAEVTWDPASAQSAVRSYYADLYAAIDSFDAATLERPIVMPGLEPYEQKLGRRFDAPTLAETMLQVATHSTYHRGQVNAHLRDAGGEPPLVDYIAWIWFGRPAPEWGVESQ
jgi:uncharacterized damage-inducible protein DinB